MRDVAVDWLAAGIDPQRAVVFVQSEVKAHAELHLLLSMMVPLPWLERVPTYKERQEQLRDKDLNTYGFLGYPLLQAADILAYRAQAVPVGEDQVPHLELCREIARRFNHLFGDVFPEPQALLTPGSAPSWNRRPEDVEVVRERDLPQRRRENRRRQGRRHAHRSAEDAPAHSRES